MPRYGHVLQCVCRLHMACVLRLPASVGLEARRFCMHTSFLPVCARRGGAGPVCWAGPCGACPAAAPHPLHLNKAHSVAPRNGASAPCAVGRAHARASHDTLPGQPRLAALNNPAVPCRAVPRASRFVVRVVCWCLQQGSHPRATHVPNPNPIQSSGASSCGPEGTLVGVQSRVGAQCPPPDHKSIDRSSDRLYSTQIQTALVRHGCRHGWWRGISFLVSRGLCGRSYWFKAPLTAARGILI